jgi:hypothetical protein
LPIATTIAYRNCAAIPLSIALLPPSPTTITLSSCHLASPLDAPPQCRPSGMAMGGGRRQWRRWQGCECSNVERNFGTSSSLGDVIILCQVLRWGVESDYTGAPYNAVLRADVIALPYDGIRFSCSLFDLRLLQILYVYPKKWAIRENWTMRLVSGIWERPICTCIILQWFKNFSQVNLTYILICSSIVDTR